MPSLLIQVVESENMNGKIQAVIAKARGFLNFDRFKVNVLFYFGNLKPVTTKILLMPKINSFARSQK